MRRMHHTLPPITALVRPNRRTLLTLGIASAGSYMLPALALTPTPASAPLALASAINRVASFRALSQRQAKAYTQLFLNVQAAKARQVMLATRQQVQAHFDSLGGQSWPAPVAQSLAQVRAQSLALGDILEHNPSKERVQQASVQADKMLDAANLATEAMEQQSQASGARLVGLAGRLRWTSQRLAKNYYLLAAGMEAKGVQTQMQADAAEFKTTLAGLQKAPVSTPAIRTQLDLAQGQWVFFDATVQRAPDERGIEAMSSASERMFEVMEQLAGAYETALKDLV